MITIDGQAVDFKKPESTTNQVKLRSGGSITINGVTVRNNTSEPKTLEELMASKTQD